MTTLPNEFGNLVNLIHLDLSFTSINSIPPAIGNLQNLEEFDLEESLALKELPEEFGQLKSLLRLNLSKTKSLKKLPNSFGKLENLEELDLGCSGVKLIPDCIYKLQKLEALTLAVAGRCNFPTDWSLRSADGRLYSNISKPPTEAFWSFPKMKHLSLRWSGSKVLPECVQKLKNLEGLSIEAIQIPERFKTKVEFQLEMLKCCDCLTNITVTDFYFMEDYDDLYERWSELQGDGMTKEAMRNMQYQIYHTSALNEVRREIKGKKIPPGLWPVILCYWTRVVYRYKVNQKGEDSKDEEDIVYRDFFPHDFMRACLLCSMTLSASEELTSTVVRYVASDFLMASKMTRETGVIAERPGGAGIAGSPEFTVRYTPNNPRPKFALGTGAPKINTVHHPPKLPYVLW